MIKTATVSVINFYQIFISTIIKNLLGVSAVCRFPETCSSYTKRQIKEKGVLKGSYLGFVRILKCQPLTA